MRRLPVIDELSSALPTDGHRRFVVPADVRGRFVRARRVAFAVLVVCWLALPTFRLAGHPLVFLDVAQRRFHLFGSVFNAQDTYLLFFALTGVAFTIALVTSLFGRAWCGWACPQTVFLEGIYRPIERLFEGSREARARRDRRGWSLDRVARKTAKHTAFLLISAVIAHVFVSLFVPIPVLWSMAHLSPSLHLEVFTWVAVVTAIFYADFAFFREQLCLVVCPYGRFQASFVDEHTMTIGYDAIRGEPRGKSEGAGDCVDCKRCVVVCPTGIDIRNGAQLDCIGCSACIDACDEIMTRLERPVGLVRYDSLEGLAGRPRKIWRPRLAIYAAACLAGMIATSVAFARRTPFETSVLRPPGAVPWVVEGEDVRNTLRIRIANKHDRPARFLVTARGDDVTASPETLAVEAAPLGVGEGLIVVVGRGRARSMVVETTDADTGEVQRTDVPFLAPSGARR